MKECNGLRILLELGGFEVDLFPGLSVLIVVVCWSKETSALG